MTLARRLERFGMFSLIEPSVLFSEIANFRECAPLILLLSLSRKYFGQLADSL